MYKYFVAKIVIIGTLFDWFCLNIFTCLIDSERGRYQKRTLNHVHCGYYDHHVIMHIP